jgi:predicted ABC-type ATPase
VPTCWIIAGPNGAGKTTFALKYLPDIARCSRFINADLIAAGLSPLAPEQELVAASRVFLREIKQAIARREDFAFETTLSGRGYLRLIDDLKQQGYQTELIYLGLPSVEMSKSRVAERVAHGGHNIPAAAIERRYPRSLANLLRDYSYAVDHCLCFLNTGAQPILIFEQAGQDRIVYQSNSYQKMMTQAEQ